MAQQLSLIKPFNTVRQMSRSTREVGLRGIAQARAVLHTFPHPLEIEPQPLVPPDLTKGAAGITRPGPLHRERPIEPANGQLFPTDPHNAAA